MEESSNILNKIAVETSQLRVDVIQELLILLKQNSKSPNSQEFWNEVSEKIWVHLMNGFEKLDDQLLCAMCFYSLIMLTDKQDHYLDKLLHIIGPYRNSFSQPFRKHKSEDLLRDELTTDISNKHSVYIVQVVSLMYGVFQSSFVTQKTYHNILKVVDVLKEMFDLLILMGYEYSQYTFLAFKTMKSFQKVCRGPLEKYIFNKENQIKLIDLVNNNWENPITGVRDLNRSIFQTVLSTLDEETYNRCLYEIDGLYWNKAKYLMLTHIVESSKENLVSFVKMKWINGLINSLHKPGLVSAGADMYYATLKEINTQDDWCHLYLSHIINILVGHNIKAIENFNNYWCLTTLKKFRELAFRLIDALEKYKYSEEILYSKLCIMKQANKLGIIDKNLLKIDTSIQKAVLAGIRHQNSNIRICAFDILCVSQGKLISSPMEYDLILDYLFNNVNSDSTVLRLSMLGCFNSFLSQLHSNFINVIIKNHSDEDVDNLIHFCKRLQHFLIHNLNIQGNYQRKITTVKLYNIILTNFCEIARKKKHQTRQANVTLKDFLKERSLWLLSTEDFIMKLISLLSDPSEDVRENVINTLISHYSEVLQNETLLTLIIDDAKNNIRSKFFYDISCSQSMFKLISKLLLKKNNSTKTQYKTVEDIFEFAFIELMSQYKKPNNVMDSIEEGKQLHSYINIILVVLEECITNTYKINIQNKMSELLEALENISQQFVWEKGCSDFSKMNDMVQNIIDDSHFRNVDEEEHTKISGMHQIVLNCMWLNVKASCDLASVLVQYNNNSVALCEQCLNIITRVLETSRHKGAIEAAGAALGRAIQYLTSLPKTNGLLKTSQSIIENSDVSLLPYILLQRKLNDLISETNKMSSITRRGAGLSIMVHRIVSSDMQKGKPLFHCFMQTLLQICNRKDHSIENHQIEMYENVANQVDLPKAIYIHFLTRIVTDSCLATDMMYYSVELAELAFGNLTSPHWQIRNAALQLYGALVPRLIGQKKASGTDEETIATIACDELRTHFPKLWVYITKQLESNCNKDLLAHSNLVPILNMLANSAKRYTILSNYTHHDSVYEKLFHNLICLLNSSIHTVRRLTARTIFNLYQFEYITNGILREEIVSENLLNGFLLLLNLSLNYYKDPKYDSSFKKLKIKFDDIFKTKRSYINKKLFEDIFGNDIDMKCIENTLVAMRSNVSPGIHNWAQARLSKYIHECSWNNIPSLITILLQDNDYEKYLEYIFLKIRTQPDITPDILRKLAEILITFEKRFHSCIIWKIVYEISLLTDLCINTEDLIKILKANFSYNIRYMLPLMARNVAKVREEHKATLLGIINHFSDFESADFDERYIAAVANNELAYNFDKLSDNLKVISFKCTIMLLQDEDEDIRNLPVKFCSVLFKDKNLLQPYICLNRILDRNFLYPAFTKPDSSLELLAKLNDVINNVLKSNDNKDKYNPFANDSKNIYFEPDVLKLFVDNVNVGI